MLILRLGDDNVVGRSQHHVAEGETVSQPDPPFTEKHNLQYALPLLNPSSFCSRQGLPLLGGK
jgi:hypothetical protein